MGMFDYVHCEVPLPDGWQQPHELQTKDFDCEMEIYTIRKDGLLMDSQKRDTEFHGFLRFYGIEGDVNSGERGVAWHWHEYRAKFTDGRLVNLEAVPDQCKS